MSDQYEKEILEELDKVGTSARSTIQDENIGLSMENIRMMETKIYEEFGTTDDGFVFRIFTAANSQEEVEELFKDKSLSEVDMTNGGLIGGIPNAALGVELLERTDNIHRSLGFADNGILLANAPNNIAFMIRVGAWISANAFKENVKPSQATDKAECLITLCMTSNRIYSIVRKESNEIIEDIIESEYYEAGSQCLVDAMIRFFVEPRQMRTEEPEMFKALLQDIHNNMETMNNNNNNQKGESND